MHPKKAFSHLIHKTFSRVTLYIKTFSTVTMYKGLFKSDNMHVIYSAELPVWASLLRWRRRDEKMGFLWPSPLSKTMRRMTWV